MLSFCGQILGSGTKACSGSRCPFVMNALNCAQRSLREELTMKRFGSEGCTLNLKDINSILDQYVIGQNQAKGH